MNGNTNFAMAMESQKIVPYPNVIANLAIMGHFVNGAKWIDSFGGVPMVQWIMAMVLNVVSLYFTHSESKFQIHPSRKSNNLLLF